MRSILCWLYFSVALVLVPGVLLAEGFDALFLRPAAGDHRHTFLTSPQLLNRYELYAGTHLSYAQAPLQVLQADQSPRKIIGHMVVQHFLFSIGFHEEKFQLDLDLPVGWEVSYRDPQVAQAALTTGRENFDTKIAVKTNLWDLKGTSTGSLSPYLTVPTGNSDKFMGVGGFAGGMMFLTDYQFIPGFRFTFNAGPLFRPAYRYRNLYQSHQLLYGLGLSMEWIPEFVMSSELVSRTRLSSPFNQRAENPTEVVGTAHFRFPSSGFQFDLGGAAGLVRGSGASKARIFLGVGARI